MLRCVAAAVSATRTFPSTPSASITSPRSSAPRAGTRPASRVRKERVRASKRARDLLETELAWRVRGVDGDAPEVVGIATATAVDGARGKVEGARGESGFRLQGFRLQSAASKCDSVPSLSPRHRPTIQCSVVSLNN